MDARGRGLSAQALGLLRAAAQHGTLNHSSCRALASSAAAELSAQPGPDLREVPRSLDRSFLQELITREARERLAGGVHLFFFLGKRTPSVLAMRCGSHTQMISSTRCTTNPLVRTNVQKRGIQERLSTTRRGETTSKSYDGIEHARNQLYLVSSVIQRKT